MSGRWRSLSPRNRRSVAFVAAAVAVGAVSFLRRRSSATAGDGGAPATSGGTAASWGQGVTSTGDAPGYVDPAQVGQAWTSSQVGQDLATTLAQINDRLNYTTPSEGDGYLPPVVTDTLVSINDQLQRISSPIPAPASGAVAAPTDTRRAAIDAFTGGRTMLVRPYGFEEVYVVGGGGDPYHVPAPEIAQQLIRSGTIAGDPNRWTDSVRVVDPAQFKNLTGASGVVAHRES